MNSPAAVLRGMSPKSFKKSFVLIFFIIKTKLFLFISHNYRKTRNYCKSSAISATVPLHLLFALLSCLTIVLFHLLIPHGIKSPKMILKILNTIKAKYTFAPNIILIVVFHYFTTLTFNAPSILARFSTTSSVTFDVISNTE